MKIPKIHRAWVILFGCTLTFYTITGLSGNCFPVYSPFIMKQHGYAKTQVSLIGSISSLAATFSVLLTGPYYRKLSLRNGMFLAGLMNALAYFVFGLADSYPVYLLASFVKGFSYGLGSMVPIAKVIENWFRSKRTLALSIVSAASGLATIGVPSLVTWLIQSFGIHNAFYINAAAFVVIYLLCWLIVRDDPKDLGLAPYEDGKEEKGKETAETEVRPLPDRWWTFLSIGVLMATCAVSCFSNLSMLTTTEGFSPETVAIAVSVSGASMMAGKLLFGAVSTSIGLKKTSFIFGLLGPAGLFFCCLIHFSSFLLFTGIILLGLDLSMLVVGSVAWVNDWALPEYRAGHVKVFQSMYNLGCLIFGLLAGISADLSGGSYIPFYACSAVIALIFAISVNAVYTRQQTDQL